MTLSSDDEAAPAPVASSSRPIKKSATTTKSTRKEQLQQSKNKKLKALQKSKKGQQGKKKAVDDVSDLEQDSDSSDEATLAQTGDDDDGLKMAKDFVFDGLGGGFIGERRNNVWVRFQGQLSFVHLG